MPVGAASALVPILERVLLHSVVHPFLPLTSDQKTSHADERSHRHPTIRSKDIAIQTLPNGRSLSTARERPRNNEE